MASKVIAHNKNNKITIIPRQIGSLINLSELDLSYNQIEVCKELFANNKYVLGTRFKLLLLKTESL